MGVVIPGENLARCSQLVRCEQLPLVYTGVVLSLEPSLGGGLEAKNIFSLSHCGASSQLRVAILLIATPGARTGWRMPPARSDSGVKTNEFVCPLRGAAAEINK